MAAGGHIGDVFGAHLSCHWDHTWTAGTEFENIRHLILYDYAIHWFDILRCFFGAEPTLADLYLYTLTTWLGPDGVDIGNYPNLRAFKETMETRASVQKARADGYFG